MNIPYWIDLAGIFFFAMSGAQAAADKRVYRDSFGVAFMGFVTAIGGGSLRDIMLDIHPLKWISDSNYLIVIGAGVLISMLLGKTLAKLPRTMMVFDSLGIALYTILGVQISLAVGVNPLAAIILGMFSAVFGGVIRDTLLNEIPLIFRKEIYATACLAGAALYVLLDYFKMSIHFSAFCGIATVIIIRLLAVRFSWSLPRMGGS
ncbi:MAG: trimeric intracellular cation channel family protein [Bacteroidota bacterium]|nr:trimeric intracellular cation channel family protein [Bacteroidota bacterium]